MPDESVSFFDRKKSWSKYKDLILDYYLRPYLAKVARIPKPVLIVDCFAGAGRFQDGTEGSPLIISKHAMQHSHCNPPIECAFIESVPELFDRLEANVKGTNVRATLLRGDFHDHIEWIADRAANSTVFLYLDPIKPRQLLFEDMKSVYDRILQGQSIEVLINFLSPPFLRQARGLTKQFSFPLTPEERKHPAVEEWDQIVGGDYWQQICFEPALSNAERVDRLAAEYACCLGRWFQHVLFYPIRAKYGDKLPKYHLIFGTRHPDAIDLMNRAMVKARREFVGAQFVEGMLFANQPAEEVINEDEIARDILETSRALGRSTWRLLRVQTTLRHPCKFTDSEINTGMKKAIARGQLGCSESGRRVSEDAEVWPK